MVSCSLFPAPCSLLLAASPFSYRPFIDPIDLHGHWYLLLIPLAFGVSMAYKAVRVKTMDRYWRNVFAMTAQIVVGMLLLGLASYFLVEVFALYVAEHA